MYHTNHSIDFLNNIDTGIDNENNNFSEYIFKDKEVRTDMQMQEM